MSKVSVGKNKIFLKAFQQGASKVVHGHIEGRRQPTLIETIQLIPATLTTLPLETIKQRLLCLEQAWQVIFVDLSKQTPIPHPVHNWHGFVTWMGMCFCALLNQVELIVVDAVRVLPLPRKITQDTWTTLFLPISPGMIKASQETWRVVLQIVSHVLLHHQSREQAVAGIRKALKHLQDRAQNNANTPRFLRAAFENNIPVIVIAPGIYQYGYGRTAQWLNSTFTLATSNLSSKLARDKWAATQRLRQAGIPVPANRLAVDANQAVTFANELGYPVVIKPADLDGGVGVEALISSDNEVRTAFLRARKFSTRVLVERHITGHDYRLTVLDDALIWAVQRIPVGVYGDGLSSINHLIEKENANPLRGEGSHAPLKKITINEDAQSILAKQQLTLDDIPELGVFVQLSTIANIAVGGQPIAVFDQVHPDNADLAIRATRALRLDLAGVDLLIPDISRSWREVGGAICEVNAQPQLGAITGPHLYAAILQHRLGGNGRIPVIVVMGETKEDMLVSKIAAFFHRLGYVVGWSDQRGVGVNDTQLMHDRLNTFDAGQMLVTDARVDIVIQGIYNHDTLINGLAVDRIDWLIVTGKPLLDLTNNGDEKANHLIHQDIIYRRVLSSCVSACVENLILLSDVDSNQQRFLDSIAINCQKTQCDEDELFARLAKRWRT